MRGFLDYAAGVFTLVLLTAAVCWGLLAGERTALATARHRLLAQAIHRATAVAALGALALHVGVKVAEARVGVRGVLVPFAAGGRAGVDGRALVIGIGSLAAWLLLAAVVTGVLRGALAGRGRASARWRALHACAYPAWCAALVHGLKSGREPAGWVTASYAMSLAAVAGVLAWRCARGRGTWGLGARSARSARGVRGAPEARGAGGGQGALDAGAAYGLLAEPSGGGRGGRGGRGEIPAWPGGGDASRWGGLPADDASRWGGLPAGDAWRGLRTDDARPRLRTDPDAANPVDSDAPIRPNHQGLAYRPWLALPQPVPTPAPPWRAPTPRPPRPGTTTPGAMPPAVGSTSPPWAPRHEGSTSPPWIPRHEDDTSPPWIPRHEDDTSPPRSPHHDADGTIQGGTP